MSLHPGMKYWAKGKEFEIVDTTSTDFIGIKSLKSGAVYKVSREYIDKYARNWH